MIGRVRAAFGAGASSPEERVAQLKAQLAEARADVEAWKGKAAHKTASLDDLAARLKVMEAEVEDLRARATRHGRTLRFGYRVHVIVRETEAEARAAAAHLVAALDDEEGRRIRERSLDSGSAGVRRQAELRDAATDDGFVEDHLWTGIGRARSGCGAAIVGDPDQVLAKLGAYRDLGIEAFILSGYPHRDRKSTRLNSSHT